MFVISNAATAASDEDLLACSYDNELLAIGMAWKTEKGGSACPGDLELTNAQRDDFLEFAQGQLKKDAYPSLASVEKVEER